MVLQAELHQELANLILEVLKVIGISTMVRTNSRCCHTRVGERSVNGFSFAFSDSPLSVTVFGVGD
jgi:hypothetical protein